MALFKVKTNSAVLNAYKFPHSPTVPLYRFRFYDVVKEANVPETNHAFWPLLLNGRPTSFLGPG